MASIAQDPLPPTTTTTTTSNPSDNENNEDFDKNKNPSSDPEFSSSVSTLSDELKQTKCSKMDEIDPESSPLQEPSRKREFNRRKSSDPVSVRKLRCPPSDDEEELDDDADVEDEEMDEEYFKGVNLGQKRRIPEYFTPEYEEKLTPEEFETSGTKFETSMTKGVSGGARRRLDPQYFSDDEDKVLSNEEFETKEVNPSEKRRIPEYFYDKTASAEEFETPGTKFETSGTNYHLTWKNHQSHILNAFESLLKTESFSDVTIICDDPEDRIKAHKIVLSACSEYFQRIFAEHEGKHPVILMQDYATWEMKALVDFMYKGEVDVQVDRLPSLIKSAESLEIRGLAESLGKLGMPMLSQKYAGESNKRRSLDGGGGDSSVALNLSIDPKGKPQIPKETSIRTTTNQNNNQLPRQNHNHQAHDDSGNEDVNPNEYEGAKQLLPRRKQARPRRRSGDYIAQDLRKSSVLPPGIDGGFNEEEGNINFSAENGLEITEDPEEETLMTRLGSSSRRRSSRRLNHERDLHIRSAMNLRNNGINTNINSNRTVLDHHHQQQQQLQQQQQRFDEEQMNLNRVLDYTTAMAMSNNKKHKRGSGGNVNPLGNFPTGQHLNFLRGWSPNTMFGTPPPAREHSKASNDGDSDDGISTEIHQSPPISPTENQKHHHHRQNSSEHQFPMFGLPFATKQPPSPSNFFLGGAMTMTPIPHGHGHGDDAGGDNTPSTPPPHPFSPANYPHGQNHNQQMKEELMMAEKQGRNGKDGGNGSRGSPVGWPGLPLGPPPIFGRHRAQHSAPRGGPPRAWSNADLTEALHNVWNKKMTTSQASRIFGIPYNSLLMYVRGKYGKSLKLDLLKKGLDQALENSQNQNNSNSSSPPSQNQTTITSPPTTTNSSTNLNNNLPKSKHHNNEHNNNNLAHHKKHSVSVEDFKDFKDFNKAKPQELPHGFNPFIFGEYPNLQNLQNMQNPFPFASALSHILPQGLVNVNHHPLGLGLRDKVSVGDEEK